MRSWMRRTRGESVAVVSCMAGNSTTRCQVALTPAATPAYRGVHALPPAAQWPRHLTRQCPPRVAPRRPLEPASAAQQGPVTVTHRVAWQGEEGARARGEAQGCDHR